jgi:hypothetical protein
MTEATALTVSENDQVGRTGSAPRAHRPRRAATAIAFVLAALLSGLLYQPWVNTPFDILDFSDFLSTLRQNDSFVQRALDLTRQYASQGRFNLLNYAALAGKWSLFGWNEAAWQIARSCQMLCIVAGVYLLLRKLGAERWGRCRGRHCS